jgi:hypothetical protein
MNNSIAQMVEERLVRITAGPVRLAPPHWWRRLNAPTS